MPSVITYCAISSLLYLILIMEYKRYFELRKY
nr:MAG TPA: hypothetical protein [Caudoviricetes sp.]